MPTQKECFVNFSNHLSQYWNEEQLDAAYQFGEIVDIPFPSVNGYASTDEIISLATDMCSKISLYKPKAVMVQGEFTLTYHVVRMLKEKGIRVVAACSERDAIEQKLPDGTAKKVSVFRFVQFRNY